MKRQNIVANLLVGFLPLFAFVAADAIWDMKIALVMATIVGVGQLGYIFLRENRFDKFVLLDTALLILFGAVSYIFDNDLFFKLKPAFIELILCILLGISAFVSPEIIFALSKHYMKGMEMNDLHRVQIKNSMTILFVIFSAHTLLIFYASFYMSKTAWAFISGGLFYILAGLYFAAAFALALIKRKKYRKQEWFPLVDPEGKIIGKAPRSLVHKRTFLLHPVVHLHVFNSKNQLYLQKRPAFKSIQPNRWDTAVGGHMALNETVDEALWREVKEELNITKFEPFFVKKYVWSSDVEEELVHIFVCRYNEPIQINTKELADGRFWDLSEIEANLGKGIFTPNLENEFPMMKEIMKKSMI